MHGYVGELLKRAGGDAVSVLNLLLLAILGSSTVLIGECAVGSADCHVRPHPPLSTGPYIAWGPTVVLGGGGGSY